MQMRASGSTALREPTVKITPALLGATLVGALGGLLFGFDTAVISGCQESLVRLFSLTKGEQGFMTASAMLGAAIGALAAAKPGDLFDDKQLNHDGRMLDVLLPTGKRAKLPGLPLEMGGRKTRVRQQPPTMGEHTRAVLAEAGYTDVQINELIAQKIVIAAGTA